MITKSKDLRTGQSLWETLPAPRVRHRRLIRNIEADVLIIGAGITGAMVADCLAEAGLRVVIADKRGPAKGSTTASTALVQHEIDHLNGVLFIDYLSRLKRDMVVRKFTKQKRTEKAL